MIRRIKVLHIITRMIRGGAQKVVLKLLEKIDRTKFEQGLLTGIETEREGSMIEDVRKLGIKIFLVKELIRNISPKYDIIAIYKIWQTIKRFRPDIVHSHTYKAGVIGSLAGRLSHQLMLMPRFVIFTPHGHIFEMGANIPGVPTRGIGLKALYFLTRFAQGCADVITALSEIDRDSQVKLLLSPSYKYVVIKNGIEISDFASSRKRQDNSQYPIIGHLGRLAGEKGQAYLIEAMRYLKTDFPQVTLLVGGSGILQEELKNYAKALSVENKIRFLGNIENSIEFFSNIDIYVHPSLYESQGLAIMEAMASKKPVIATDVGGISDLVKHNQTGILVPPRDAKALADAIINLIQDATLAKNLAEGGFERISREYSADNMVKNYQNLYERLLEQRN
jgi:glycosyltransferase involved in cell wall biosynthesis